MCLHTISKVYDSPDKKVQYGWKVFVIFDGNLQGEIFNQNVVYKYDKWYKARGRKILGYTTALSYPAGFHVFVSRHAALKWARRMYSRTTRRVKYRKAVAIGRQKGVVVVAKEICILRPARKCNRSV